MAKPEWSEMPELEGPRDTVRSEGTFSAPNPVTNVQYVRHETVQPGPTFTVRVEKNSRSVNIELAVHGARSPEEAVESLRRLKEKVDGQVIGLFEGKVNPVD